MFPLISKRNVSPGSVVAKAFNGAGVGTQTHDLHVKTLDGDIPPPPRVSGTKLRFNGNSTLVFQANPYVEHTDFD